MVTLTASASAPGTDSVSSVQFRVDGAAVGAADSTAPYSFVWNTTTVANGVHQITAVVTDSANQTVTSAAVSLTVSNGSGGFAVQLAADELFPQPATSATGTGSFTADTSNGQLSGSITLTGVTATGAEIGDAYAGAASAAVVSLSVNGENTQQWDIPGGATLSAQQLADLSSGKLYVLVRSAQFPNGELRGQLLPAGIVVKFAALTGEAEVPAVTSSSTGQVAVTVDAANLHAVANINVAGLAATGAELDIGAAGVVGTSLATLAVDATNPNHFLNEAITLTSADVTAFNNSQWYGNVTTAAHPSGELRGQIGQASTAPTLTQLQADIFTPICSVCHTGVGASLPGSQNLTAGHTYASIVNVTSIEQPSMKRIVPGDPDSSYLVLKIQGSPGIVGVQMPASGGPLSQAQIDEVRAWVAAGALNN